MLMFHSKGNVYISEGIGLIQILNLLLLQMGQKFKASKDHVASLANCDFSVYKSTSLICYFSDS